MNLKNEEDKVQLLYFPIAEHQKGKLYIKLNEDESIYDKLSGSVVKKSNIIFDAKKKEDGVKLEYSKTSSMNSVLKKELDKIETVEPFFSKSFSQKSHDNQEK